MKLLIDQLASPSKNKPQLTLVIVSVILTAIVVGSGTFWWADQEQNELKNEVLVLQSQVNQLRGILSKKSTQIIQPTSQPSQQLLEKKSTEYSNDGVKINQNTIYKNTTLAFQMTFPAGWYLPPLTDDDPHAYSCATEYCTNGALEVQGDNDFSNRNFEEFLSERKEEDADAKELINFIKGARVIKGKAPGPAEGWAYEYDIIFYNQKKGFLIFTNNDNLEQAILPSFRLLQ